ncbi:hypothetical protein, partial [Pedobacter jamesrossensis]|uniref:hypothetical protein n=1 Tax=Pedobacter jamesrossensis TaxID=1908238 RepID=UPI003619E245
FGSIDSKVSERNRADNTLLDVSSAVELGKFLPQKSGVKIPMYVSYSKTGFNATIQSENTRY